MSDDTTGEDTPKKSPRDNLMPPWRPGQSGNPAGRPKSARSKLSEDFFKALAADFADNGKAVIQIMRAERPGDYAKMIASLQTKEVDVPEGGSLIDAIAYRIIDGRA